MNYASMNSPEFVKDIQSALKLREKITALSAYVKSQKVKIDKKTDLVREILGDDKSEHNFLNLDELQIPHKPYAKAFGVRPEKALVFKSAIAPLMLVLDCKEYP